AGPGRPRAGAHARQRPAVGRGHDRGGPGRGQPAADGPDGRRGAVRELAPAGPGDQTAVAGARPQPPGPVDGGHGAAGADGINGAGRPANVAGQPVFGQVGNVSLGPQHGGLRAVWFVGYRGGVAFAVLELTRSASSSAATVARTFLQNLPAGT